MTGVVCKFKKSDLLLLTVLLVFPGSVFCAESAELCKSPLTDKDVIKIFKQNTLNQLALEFGRDGSFVYDVEMFLVDDTLTGLEAYARYPKPGQKDLARMRFKGWVNRCSGTTVVRGNTWLADGTLKVRRYSVDEMKGRGLLWGNKDAPLRFIVYLDSRCPHCHRLIEYARKLVAEGKVLLDLRQVAYLEKSEEAIQDTLLSRSSLVVKDNPPVNDEEYLELLAGNNSADDIKTDSQEYRDALKLINQNTKTAEKVLHIITVPGVLIQEKEQGNQYRKMGYWEINRIFQ
jgi:glutaredoxin